MKHSRMISFSGVVVVSLVLALGQLVAPSPAQAVERADLVGTWTSVDTDGSNQWLSIQGGGADHYAVFLFDDAATNVCDGAPARATGSGRTDGDDLFVDVTLTCYPGGNVFRERLGLAFTYDSASGTLVDFSGVVWYRS